MSRSSHVKERMCIPKYINQSTGHSQKSYLDGLIPVSRTLNVRIWGADNPIDLTIGVFAADQ
jgi:hypothetical protein